MEDDGGKRGEGARSFGALTTVIGQHLSGGGGGGRAPRANGQSINSVRPSPSNGARSIDEVYFTSETMDTHSGHVMSSGYFSEFSHGTSG